MEATSHSSVAMRRSRRDPMPFRGPSGRPEVIEQCKRGAHEQNQSGKGGNAKQRLRIGIKPDKLDRNWQKNQNGQRHNRPQDTAKGHDQPGCLKPQEAAAFLLLIRHVQSREQGFVPVAELHRAIIVLISRLKPSVVVSCDTSVWTLSAMRLNAAGGRRRCMGQP